MEEAFRDLAATISLSERYLAPTLNEYALAFQIGDDVGSSSPSSTVVAVPSLIAVVRSVILASAPAIAFVFSLSLVSHQHALS